MESILTSIKKLLGIAEDYKHFDTDIIIYINGVFMALSQIGVGPKGGYSISSEMETWDAFLGDAANLEAVKSYVYIKVRLLFDPPTNSSVLEALKKQADEYEWRLNTQAESVIQEA